MLSTVLLLILVTALFSYLTDSKVEPEQLSVSEVVKQVQAREVKEIIVRGSLLEIDYNDETRNKGEAKRETDAAVSESLTNFGVTAEQLAAIKIDVQRETGFAYWFGQFAPFLFSVTFPNLNYLVLHPFSKGCRDAGVEFGNSKAQGYRS